MSLKRYDFYNPGSIPLVQSDNGQYVLFSDVEHLVSALQKLELIHFDWLRTSFDLPEIRQIIRDGLEKSGVGMRPENSKIGMGE